jgi:hypothetical protein
MYSPRLWSLSVQSCWQLLKRLVLGRPLIPLPEPPVNVRLVYANGTVVAVDTVYTGRDARGIHIWEAIQRPSDTGTVQITGMRIDLLPAHTEVSVSGNWRT